MRKSFIRRSLKSRGSWNNFDSSSPCVGSIFKPSRLFASLFCHRRTSPALINSCWANWAETRCLFTSAIPWLKLYFMRKWSMKHPHVTAFGHNHRHQKQEQKGHHPHCPPRHSRPTVQRTSPSCRSTEKPQFPQPAEYVEEKGVMYQMELVEPDPRCPLRGFLLPWDSISMWL